MAILNKGSEFAETASPGQQAVSTVDRLSGEWETMELMLKRALLQDLVDTVTIFDDRFDIKLRLL